MATVNSIAVAKGSMQPAAFLALNLSFLTTSSLALFIDGIHRGGAFRKGYLVGALVTALLIIPVAFSYAETITVKFAAWLLVDCTIGAVLFPLASGFYDELKKCLIKRHSPKN